jgi:uncharacterized membrane protein YraQ (UPF0718 family)
MELVAIYALTGAALIVSFVLDRKKSILALKKAGKKLLAILPQFLLMLVFISIVLTLLPEQLIRQALHRNNTGISVLFAAVIGSVTIIPGFVAFPLAGILRAQGVPYMVLSAFTTTLMMVGILTFPLEKEYFGFKQSFLRNLFCALIALFVAFVTGLFFGEISI